MVRRTTVERLAFGLDLVTKAALNAKARELLGINYDDLKDGDGHRSNVERAYLGLPLLILSGLEHIAFHAQHHFSDDTQRRESAGAKSSATVEEENSLAARKAQRKISKAPV